jgi:hypothetical protein
MLFKHILAVADDGNCPIQSSSELIRKGFTQEPTFRELVKACEGVPRDAINILQIAATRAQQELISIPHVRESAKDWYERDKAANIEGNPNSNKLLQWIIGKVIGDRKAKAFLVRSDVRNDILEHLFDERVLHIARRTYSAKDEPGVRYRVWKIDYGCYVDLINTSRSPTGFLIDNVDLGDEEAFVVPDDDFRAIRRAVLDLGEFEKKVVVSA